jgi:tRNA (guanine37-N1)-methyltransferase
VNIYLITLFPELIEQATAFGVLGRAVKQQQLTLQCFNPRDFTEDKHRTVDDRPYGGGPGMLMKVEPLAKAILAAKDVATDDAKVIYLSPQGQTLNQQMVVAIAAQGATRHTDLILIAGRYEGIDERLIDTLIDEEWSIGDYVLSGGEFAALVVVDAVTRLLPGVLGDDESALQDSFMQGLLDYPHYTRPETIVDSAGTAQTVPEVLLSGDHKAIQRWRLKQALGRTWLRRPDLLDTLQEDASGNESLTWDETKATLLAEFKKEYNVKNTD